MALWACMLNLLFIAALPRAFFRRGSLNANWWLTAAPFAGAGFALLLAVPSAVAAGAELLPALFAVGAIALACGSIALIAFTLGTHREPVSLWHQQDDTPHQLVRHGAYARVRHPFYAAFLLALMACVLAAPGPLTVVAFASAAFLLRRTAQREEARLLASGFGAEYAAYMTHTGRFTPRLHHASSRPPART